MQSALLDAAGHRRSPVTMPGFHEHRAPRNKGHRYPADPPTVEESIAVMRTAGSGPDARLRALALAETDLDVSRRGPGAPRRHRWSSVGVVFGAQAIGAYGGARGGAAAVRAASVASRARGGDGA